MTMVRLLASKVYMQRRKECVVAKPFVSRSLRMGGNPETPTREKYLYFRTTFPCDLCMRRLRSFSNS